MVNSSNALMPPFPPSIGNESFDILIDKNNNNNDRLTAFDPGQPG